MCGSNYLRAFHTSRSTFWNGEGTLSPSQMRRKPKDEDLLGRRLYIFFFRLSRLVLVAFVFLCTSLSKLPLSANRHAGSLSVTAEIHKYNPGLLWG